MRRRGDRQDAPGAPVPRQGDTEHNEPGLFIAFEETEEELARNVASLGFDLEKLIRQKKLFIDYVRVERHEIEETGEYDLEELFVRIGHAIQTVNAKRIVLDTLESLFAGLANVSILRAEFRRLFRWLKEKRMTAVITAEAGDGATLTRQGMEEYVSDCVILLDHRVAEHMSARRMRVVKYRGSMLATVAVKKAKSVERERVPPRWPLRLYVAGQTAKSVVALTNLQRFCEEHLAGQYSAKRSGLTLFSPASCAQRGATTRNSFQNEPA